MGVVALVGSVLLPLSARAALDTGTIAEFIGDGLSNALNGRITCSVEATSKLVGLTKNEVTYKLKYTSNYSQLNASYALQAGSPEKFLDEKKGAFSLVKGTNLYVPLTSVNGTERKFTYDIEGNPSVTIQANIKGTKCTTKVLTTKKPAASNLNPSVIANSQANTQFNGANMVQQPDIVSGNAPVAQAHSCQVLAEAVKQDEDTLKIGGAIKFDNLAKGKIAYSIRGFLSNNPNQVKEYSGVYTNLNDGGSGVIVDQGQKGFVFLFDAKTPLDKYVVTATIGNVDCKLLYFASPIKLQVNQPNLNGNLNVNGNVQQNNNSNGSDVASDNGGSSEVAGESDVTQPVGIDSSTEADLQDLNLVGGKVTADNNDQQGKEAQNIVVGDEAKENETREKMYLLYGALGTIVVAGGVYGVLRYKGMI